ncbi:MAG: hypothetical protein N3A62_00525 [Thermodesulfovibrionales bacterium]|nr:hypothetical protein [Thermodesulfovibrionales bacterium]
MSEIKYKQYDEEETRIYEENLDKVRRYMNEGMTFNEAADIINVEDKELKDFILDDALKIFIAERHFVLGMPLTEMSQILNLDLTIIQKAVFEMLEDVGHTSQEYQMMIHGHGTFGNA